MLSNAKAMAKPKTTNNQLSVYGAAEKKRYNHAHILHVCVGHPASPGAKFQTKTENVYILKLNLWQRYTESGGERKGGKVGRKT